MFSVSDADFSKDKKRSDNKDNTISNINTNNNNENK